MGLSVKYGFLPVVAVVATALFAHFSQFTWWSWQTFTVYSALYAVGWLRPQFAFFAAANALLVAIGVFVMSMLGEPDSMLVNTAADYGLLVYGAGTFAVHYFPLAVVASTAPLPTRDDREGLEAGILAAISLFVVYISFNDPSKVYGVPLGAAVAFAVCVLFLLVSLTVLWFAGFR